MPTAGSCSPPAIPAAPSRYWSQWPVPAHRGASSRGTGTGGYDACRSSPSAEGVRTRSSLVRHGWLGLALLAALLSGCSESPSAPTEEVLVSARYHRRPPITHPESLDQSLVMTLCDSSYNVLLHSDFVLPSGVDDWEWPSGMRLVVGTTYYINVYDAARFNPPDTWGAYVNQDIYMNNVLVTNLVTVPANGKGCWGQLAVITIIDREGHFK
jgi:hypothetical protein